MIDPMKLSDWYAQLICACVVAEAQRHAHNEDEGCSVLQSEVLDDALDMADELLENVIFRCERWSKQAKQTPDTTQEPT
jgi:hypothetical protein